MKYVAELQDGGKSLVGKWTFEHPKRDTPWTGDFTLTSVRVPFLCDLVMTRE